MSINRLILQNLKKNLKNYYLYIFALVFTVGLYFAFVTLQYDPALDVMDGSVKGAAAMRTASVLLLGIVTIFILYANTIFIKRRSTEIGLYQLIGMTKGRIHRILSLENLMLYSGSLLLGIFLGFAVSKLIMMILYKITGIEIEAVLRLSTEALVQTVVVFGVIYGFIMLMNYVFIKRQTILSLFRVLSSTEETVKKVSLFEMFVGIVGIALILFGYYVSTLLFGGDFTQMMELVIAMLAILGSVIIGTYLFYKGSVRFIFYVMRKRKGGYLNINEVLSLSSIMFRMKSNAMLLTIITTVSALAIGLLSLSYISYYSAERMARNNVAGDYALTHREDADRFTAALEQQQIGYAKREVEVIRVDVNVEQITNLNGGDMLDVDTSTMSLPVVSDANVDDVDATAEQVYFTGYDDLLRKFMPLKDSGTVELLGQNEVISQQYMGLRKDYVISYNFSNGGLPIAIVDESVFARLKQDLDPEVQRESTLFIGIDLANEAQLEEANDLFLALEKDYQGDYLSRLVMSNTQKANMGLIMFIVGFLGLSFLITSGCILYFKQMGESEEEKPSYTILRKLGFTQGDLLRGIRAKQLFNFGIPLVVGLAHSYFAVQSGWFLFGTEVWTPMIMVMMLYTALYSVFGLLSVRYYKKVIKEAL
jgi:bacitracin transport system permease protein